MNSKFGESYYSCETREHYFYSESVIIFYQLKKILGLLNIIGYKGCVIIDTGFAYCFALAFSNGDSEVWSPEIAELVTYLHSKISID